MIWTVLARRRKEARNKRKRRIEREQITKGLMMRGTMAISMKVKTSK